MGGSRVAALLAIALMTRTAAADELAIDTLAWPSSTQSARAPDTVDVFDAAGGKHLGTLARGTRVAWTQVVEASGRCKLWLVIAPEGFVCARDLQPSDDPPAGIEQPTLTADGAIGRFADVRGVSAPSYDSVDAIRAGTPTRDVPGTTFVSVKPRSVRVDGVRYKKTDQGWIEASLLRGLTSSEFAGTDTPPAFPFAWAVGTHKGATITTRAEPSRHGEAVETLEPRTIVPVLAEEHGWVEVGDGEWLKKSEVRIARQIAPPDGVAADERWIDVDLDQQVLVAYQGATPVFATMVSTGRKKFPTPTGIYRIQEKHGRTRMHNPKASPTQWDVADVPWAMKFRKYFALHGAYWHDGFGKPRSHGCINLSPHDARWLYGWTAPEVPLGWMMIEVPGTPVRVHSRHDPDPVWKDFKGKPLTNLADRPAKPRHRHHRAAS